MALGPSACLGGFRCISLLHTRARSLRLASPRQGKAWLAWYGMVWYGVLAPNHPMRLVESRLLQNCLMGFSQIFLYKCVFSTAMVQKRLGTTGSNFEKKRRFLMALGPSACLGGFRCISPPPLGGERSLGPNSIENTSRCQRRQRKFLQGAEGDSHCDTMVQFCGATPPPLQWGNRHFVIAPLPLVGWGGPSRQKGGDYRGEVFHKTLTLAP